MSPRQPRIVISYRRKDNAGYARHIYADLVRRFGKHDVLMDLDIPESVDYADYITGVISSCRVLIVVMGPNWATVTKDGKPRIEDPDDLVRLEIETALKRPGVKVYPVLVDDAQMPDPVGLPESLRPLTRRNARDLRDADWDYHMGLLITRLEQVLGTGPRRGRLVAEGALVAGVAGLTGRLLATALPNPREVRADGDAVAIAAAMLRRAEIWALVGVALAVWLALRYADRERLTGWAGKGLLVGALAGAMGGAVVAFPVHLSDEHATATLGLILAALGTTGGLIGALLGGLWRPPNVAFGIVVGASAGVLIELILNGPGSGLGEVVKVGIRATAIAGSALGALAAAEAARISQPAAVGGARQQAGLSPVASHWD
jgi:TIR domain